VQYRTSYRQLSQDDEYEDDGEYDYDESEYDNQVDDRHSYQPEYTEEEEETYDEEYEEDETVEEQTEDEDVAEDVSLSKLQYTVTNESVCVNTYSQRTRVTYIPASFLRKRWRETWIARTRRICLR
jgi:hypothetical protein